MDRDKLLRDYAAIIDGWRPIVEAAKELNEHRWADTTGDALAEARLVSRLCAAVEFFLRAEINS